MKRRTLFGAAFGIAAVTTAALVTPSLAGGKVTSGALPVPHPALMDYQFVSGSETPPSNAQCESVGRTCFTPQAIQSAYNVGPLYAAGLDGSGMTIAIVDSWGSDTIAHDLHVFNNAFGLAHMCGEEGVTCAPGMPTFTVMHPNGSPATKPQPGNGTNLEDKTLWDLETTLDVETAHAIAPGANILLVATTGAETLGVQGFPNMMKAEQTVVDNHMAQVISQSFASAEEAFGSTASLLNLRFALQDAAANGVTVFGASGDDGTANRTKQSLLKHDGNIIPFPTVEWPASDPLVTGVGGTYLCTNPLAGTNDPRTPYFKLGVGAKCGSNTFNPGHNLAEVAWTFSGGGFSHIFAKPAYQNTLPAGSTAIGSARGVPDIAFQASAGTGALVYITLPPDGQGGLMCGSSPCSTGWYDIGGTSLGTPQWAGLAAIGAQLKGHGLGLINGALYTIASNPAKYAADFYDVATNNTNQSDPSVPGYPATTGWDPVTGLGTPNAAHLIPDLVALTP